MKKRVDYLSIEQYDELVKHVSDKRDDLILGILYETGCTVNELVNVKIKNVDFKGSRICFPSESTKTHKPRISYVSGSLIKKIKEFIKEGSSDYVLSTRQSKQITTKRIRQIIQSYSAFVNIEKLNPQILRYTHIAHAIKKGIPAKAVQEHVGIDSLRMSQICDSIIPEEKEDVYKKFFAK